MAGDGETRRLAAIMASDVVGYTALMGAARLDRRSER